jgi:hypothetical protein
VLIVNITLMALVGIAVVSFLTWSILPRVRAAI